MNPSIFVALTILLLAGCKTETNLQPREPLVHRATAGACPTTRAAANCNVSTGGASCAADSECTGGTNGRCVGNSHDGCSCSYDTCSTDGDCTADQLCACRNDWHYGPDGPNVCLPSNCRVDADCGVGGYCSPSLDPGCGAYFGVTLWRCHTAKDKCVDDADCTNLDGGYGAPFCGYSPELGYWACSTTQCVG